MSNIEQAIIDNALDYQQNPKEVWKSKEGGEEDWFAYIHQHFNHTLLPQFNHEEKFIEYWPVYMMWGQRTQTEQGIANKDTLYRVSYGTFGTGYLCLTNQRIYLLTFANLTRKYPLYEPPGCLRGFFLAMTGKIDERRPAQQDKTWSIDQHEIVGAQIVDIDDQDEFIKLVTSPATWAILPFFSKHHIREVLVGISLLRQGKLHHIGNANKSQQASQLSTNPVNLLQQLLELRDAGILTEAEYVAKKREILSRL